MEQASSIFSSRIQQRLLIGCFSLALALYCAAPWISESVGSSFGAKITNLTDGRAQDPARFVSNRLVEASSLFCCLGIATIVFACTTQVVNRIRLLPMRVIVGGCACFAVMNSVVFWASNTLLFWLSLYACHPIFKETSFHIERMLLAESSATHRVALLGSSQAASEFDSGKLTQSLYPAAQVGTMHFAGAHPSDFLNFLDYVNAADASEVICYLSEQSLYTRTSGHILLPLSTPKGVGRMKQCGVENLDLSQAMRFGRLGQLLPVFRIRRAARSALGGDVTENGVRLPARGKLSIEDFAEQEAQKYDLKHSPFEKCCFKRFIKAAEDVGIRVILIQGQVSPVLESKLDPDIHKDFTSFMNGIKSEFPEVEILTDAVHRHSASEYSDLMHVREKTKTENSRLLAEKLAKLVSNGKKN